MLRPLSLEFFWTLPTISFSMSERLRPPSFRTSPKPWDKERESNLRELWQKAWLGVASRTEVDIDDPVTQANSHVAGILAGAALARLGKRTLRPQSGIPSSVRPYFDPIARCQDGHLGRVRLTASLNRLFTIDPEWTDAVLVHRLNPRSGLFGSPGYVGRDSRGRRPSGPPFSPP